MSEQTTERMTVKASPSRCFDVATDFEHYPEWAADIKDVKVLDRDSDGNAVKVAFWAAAMGRSTRYTLLYDYSKAPTQLSWTLAEGDMMKQLDGTYVFEGSDDQTEITYHLTIELLVPVPGFVKRRTEGRILQALRELKARAES